MPAPTVVGMIAVKTDPVAESFTDQPPLCECVHPMPWGDEPCGLPAEFLVTFHGDAGDSGAGSYLFCAECTDAWQERERRRFGVARLHITPLP